MKTFTEDEKKENALCAERQAKGKCPMQRIVLGHAPGALTPRAKDEEGEE